MSRQRLRSRIVHRTGIKNSEPVTIAYSPELGETSVLAVPAVGCYTEKTSLGTFWLFPRLGRFYRFRRVCIRYSGWVTVCIRYGG